MSQEEERDRLTFIRDMEARGLGWQYHGPVLRNSADIPASKYHWSLFETIVWIATRDEEAVAGAANLLHQGGSEDVAINAQVVIDTTLPRDVAGHHLQCAGREDGVSCNCDDLKRQRYCRCKDRSTNSHHSCSCTRKAIGQLFDRLQRGLTLSGRLKGEEGFKKVPLEAFAGATLAYTQTGVGLLKEYAELKVSRSDVESIWPSDFSDMPIPLSAPRSSPQQQLLDELESYAVPGRPSAELVGLKLLCDRLQQGLVERTNTDEGAAIVKSFPKKLRQRDPDIPTVKVARGWLSKFHKRIRWNAEGPENVEEVERAALAAMRAIVDQKTGGAARKL